jgi:transcriptional regulator
VYLPQSFREDRPEVLADAMRAHPLAQFITYGAEGLEASPIPMLFEQAEGRQGALLGHLARANGQWKTADPAVEALAIFSGPQHYISPGWYETKRETGKVVPTWNYITIQVRGRLSFHHDAGFLLDVVRRLTERHEAGRASPWAVSDAPEDFVAGQLRAIVGLRMEITSITGKWKMSQNRGAADRAGVVQGLRDEGSLAADDVAGAVEQVLREG